MFQTLIHSAVLVSLCTALCGAQNSGTPYTILAVRQEQRATIAGGTQREYHFTAQSGQYFRVEIEPERIDITVLMFDPSGKLISRSGLLETFTLRGISATTGDYRIVLTSLEPSSEGGDLVIVLDELRTSTDADGLRVSSQAAQQAAQRLLRQSDTSTYSRVGESLEETCATWHRLGEGRAEATTLTLLGALYQRSSNPQGGLDAFRKADRIYLALGATSRSVVTRRARLTGDIALAQYALGDRLNLFKDLTTSIALFTTLGRIRELVALLRIKAHLLWISDKRADAARCFQEALDLLDTHLLFSRTVALLDDLAHVSSVLGDRQKSLGYYDRALLVCRRLSLRSAEASILIRVGSLHTSAAEYDKALSSYVAAAQLQAITGDRNGRLEALYRAAAVLLKSGDSDNAIAQLQEALNIACDLQQTLVQASILRQLGLAYKVAGQYDTSIKAYMDSLALSKTPATLIDLGVAYFWREDYDRALHFYQQAIDETQVTNSVLRSIATMNIGWVYLRKGDSSSALKYLARAKQQLRNAAKNLEDDEVLLYGLSRAESMQGHLQRARELIERAVELVETKRASVGSPELRASYMIQVLEGYEFYVDLLMLMHSTNPRGGFDVLALGAAEMAKARSLSDVLADTNADFRVGGDAELLAEERRVQKQLSDKAEMELQVLMGGQSSNQLSGIWNDTGHLLGELRMIRSRIRASSSVTGNLRSATARHLDLTAIQRELGPDTTLLEYALGESHSYLWVVNNNTLTSYILPRREVIEREASAAYRALVEGTVPRGTRNSSEAFDGLALKLAEVILTPAASSLIKGHRLVIVPDGSLHYIPFAALPNPAAPGERLIVDHEIVMLPSLSVISALRKRRAQTHDAQKALIMIADPIFDLSDPRVTGAPGRELTRVASLRDAAVFRGAADLGFVDSASKRMRLPRLSFTREEAESITGLFPTGQFLRLTGSQATVTNLKAAGLNDYRFIHFATHAVLNPTRPELSGVILSLFDEHGAAQPGLLKLEDVYDLRLSAELVVLSACQTALGTVMKGEGIIGLTRGFLSAGAARVLASLWKVDDSVTSELMQDFYRGVVSGLPPAASLRAAQIRMLQSRARAAPINWAAFTLQGEWR